VACLLQRNGPSMPAASRLAFSPARLVSRARASRDRASRDRVSRDRVSRAPRSPEEAVHARWLRSTLALFSVYFAVLVAVTLFVADGADLGCILAGVAGHVLYATFRLAVAWRDMIDFERVLARVSARA
jgi:hypothetical protein